MRNGALLSRGEVLLVIARRLERGAELARETIAAPGTSSIQRVKDRISEADALIEGLLEAANAEDFEAGKSGG